MNVTLCLYVVECFLKTYKFSEGKLKKIVSNSDHVVENLENNNLKMIKGFLCYESSLLR